MLSRFAFLLFFIFQAGSASLASPDQALPDAAQEMRARALFHQLRCVVCQSESVAESKAEVALDIRAFVRERIADGQNDDEIKSFLVSRYGDFILMRPPLKTSTVFLWAGPLIFLLIGMLIVFSVFFNPKQRG